MPLVFHDFVLAAKEGGREGGRALVYAGNLRQEFDPSSVFISPRSGRLYHPLTNQRKGGGTAATAAAAAAAGGGGGGREGGREGGRPRFGLLRSHVGLLLSDRLVHVEGDGDELVLMWGREGGREGGGEGGREEEEEEGFLIRALPEEEEPIWGMPSY